MKDYNSKHGDIFQLKKQQNETTAQVSGTRTFKSLDWLWLIKK